MSQNGQTHFKNLAAFAVRFLKCMWPFLDIIHFRVNHYTLYPFCHSNLYFSLPNMVKLHGAPLQPFVAMYKVRLYQLLRLVQPKYFEFSFTPLLRVLVAEFTLADKKGSITTSLLQSLCHQDDSILLGSWLQETDHKEVEEQVSALFHWLILTLPD